MFPTYKHVKPLIEQLTDPSYFSDKATFYISYVICGMLEPIILDKMKEHLYGNIK